MQSKKRTLDDEHKQYTKQSNQKRCRSFSHLSLVKSFSYTDVDVLRHQVFLYKDHTTIHLITLPTDTRVSSRFVKLILEKTNTPDIQQITTYLLIINKTFFLLFLKSTVYPSSSSIREQPRSTQTIDFDFGLQPSTLSKTIIPARDRLQINECLQIGHQILGETIDWNEPDAISISSIHPKEYEIVFLIHPDEQNDQVDTNTIQDVIRHVLHKMSHDVHNRHDSTCLLFRRAESATLFKQASWYEYSPGKNRISFHMVLCL